jgi:hypothetical protein
MNIFIIFRTRCKLDVHKSACIQLLCKLEQMLEDVEASASVAQSC